MFVLTGKKEQAYYLHVHVLIFTQKVLCCLETVLCLYNKTFFYIYFQDISLYVVKLW